MYTRCAHCLSVLNVTVQQLRAGRGLVGCDACGKSFDALDAIKEQVEIFPALAAPAIVRLKTRQANPKTWVWAAAAGCALLLLLAQILYFEGDNLLRQPQIRANLAFFCENLGCRLPVYKNLKLWSVSHANLAILSGPEQVFTAVVTNQAGFPQAFPDLKLTMLDVNGQPVAERVFAGSDYTAEAVLSANDSAEIKLNIVAPANTNQLGGYAFGLQ